MNLTNHTLRQKKNENSASSFFSEKKNLIQAQINKAFKYNHPRFYRAITTINTYEN